MREQDNVNDDVREAVNENNNIEHLRNNYNNEIIRQISEEDLIFSQYINVDQCQTPRPRLVRLRNSTTGMNRTVLVSERLIDIVRRIVMLRNQQLEPENRLSSKKFPWSCEPLSQSPFEYYFRRVSEHNSESQIPFPFKHLHSPEEMVCPCLDPIEVTDMFYGSCDTYQEKQKIQQLVWPLQHDEAALEAVPVTSSNNIEIDQLYLYSLFVGEHIIPW